eukprot:CAMPEP_0202921402 /NCGR_PEP_ID=MMETSP1392-20130828/77376_1 /ASSEMBLY_ACC=CAM_ASM_000868 /TAXON_ID=225041 /ORGANISM="Chlamydomonas chlamydogama, Strain SAG 11-48b" /LENGTH=530 /DNA_ID=CAMNT_0049614973 /DNA_START=165 /DNA_END=1757 /DNA_ORIENTATION=+
MSREPTDDGFALPYLRQLWGDRELSDAKLIIGTTQHDDCERTIVQSLVCDVHSHVLIGGSEYFMAKVKNWRSTKKQGRGSSKKKQRTAEDSRMVLEMVLEPDDDPDAARQAVRFLYFGELSEEVKAEPAMLFKVARMADAFLMPACLRACVRALSALSPEQLLSSCCLGQVLQLPEVYKPSLGFGAAVAAAAGELLKQVGATSPPELGSGTPLGASFMDLMGSVPHLIATPDLLTTFMELPFEWVCWWASSDQLATDHENSVASVLLYWIMKNVRSPRVEQTKQVLSCIRFQQLSASYMDSMCQKLFYWLNDLFHHQSIKFPEDYRVFVALLKAPPSFPGREEVLANPLFQSWSRDKGPRCHVSSVPQLPFTFIFNVTESKMRQVMEQAGTEQDFLGIKLGLEPVVLDCDTAHFSSGWCVRPQLRVKQDKPDVPKFQLGMKLNVSNALPSLRTDISSYYYFRHDTALIAVQYGCQSSQSSTGTFRVLEHLGTASSWEYFLTQQPVTAAELCDSFLVDGEFRFRVVLKALV